MQLTLPPRTSGNFQVDLSYPDVRTECDIFCQYDIRIQWIVIQLADFQRQTGLLLHPGDKRSFQMFRFQQTQGQPDRGDQSQNGIKKPAEGTMHEKSHSEYILKADLLSV